MKGARRPARAPPPSCECFPTSDDRNCARLVACRHHTSRQRMVQGECRPNYRPVSKIGDVLRQWRRTEAGALVAHDARFHHHPPGVRPQPDRDRRPATAAEPGPAPALARSEAVADMPGLLRGPHHLADEGLRTLAAPLAVVDAPRPEAQIVVAPRHDSAPRCDPGRRRSSN